MAVTPSRSTSPATTCVSSSQQYAEASHDSPTPIPRRSLSYDDLLQSTNSKREPPGKRPLSSSKRRQAPVAAPVESMQLMGVIRLDQQPQSPSSPKGRVSSPKEEEEHKEEPETSCKHVTIKRHKRTLSLSKNKSRSQQRVESLQEQEQTTRNTSIRASSVVCYRNAKGGEKSISLTRQTSSRPQTQEQAPHSARLPRRIPKLLRRRQHRKTKADEQLQEQPQQEREPSHPHDEDEYGLIAATPWSTPQSKAIAEPPSVERTVSVQETTTATTTTEIIHSEDTLHWLESHRQHQLRHQMALAQSEEVPKLRYGGSYYDDDEEDENEPPSLHKSRSNLQKLCVATSSSHRHRSFASIYGSTESKGCDKEGDDDHDLLLLKQRSRQSNARRHHHESQSESHQDGRAPHPNEKDNGNDKEQEEDDVDYGGVLLRLVSSDDENSNASNDDWTMEEYLARQRMQSLQETVTREKQYSIGSGSYYTIFMSSFMSQLEHHERQQQREVLTRRREHDIEFHDDADMCFPSKCTSPPGPGTTSAVNRIPPPGITTLLKDLRCQDDNDSCPDDEPPLSTSLERNGGRCDPSTNAADINHAGASPHSWSTVLGAAATAAADTCPRIAKDVVVALQGKVLSTNNEGGHLTEWERQKDVPVEDSLFPCRRDLMPQGPRSSSSCSSSGEDSELYSWEDSEHNSYYEYEEEEEYYEDVGMHGKLHPYDDDYYDDQCYNDSKNDVACRDVNKSQETEATATSTSTTTSKSTRSPPRFFRRMRV